MAYYSSFHSRPVHHLEDSKGHRVAMLGSRFFIKELWSVTNNENRQVVELLMELLQEFQIVVTKV